MDSRAYELARWEPVYGTMRRTPRPSHIVVSGRSSYGGYRHNALCGVQGAGLKPVTEKITRATCGKCLRRAIKLGIINAPPELGDPVHHGDIFSRIEASQ